jgi:fatty acid desaturase
VTALQKKSQNPIAHLSAEDIEIIGKELDTIRQEVRDSLGEDDARYIRRVIDVQRKLELGSRAALLVSMFPPAWVVGTVGLSVAKILENMEIGHNILHGQWDWMRDPKIHSTTWEWDMASPAESWGLDGDIGCVGGTTVGCAFGLRLTADLSKHSLELFRWL